jgi:hypothetical protein
MDDVLLESFDRFALGFGETQGRQGCHSLPSNSAVRAHMGGWRECHKRLF